MHKNSEPSVNVTLRAKVSIVVSLISTFTVTSGVAIHSLLTHVPARMDGPVFIFSPHEIAFIVLIIYVILVLFPCLVVISITSNKYALWTIFITNYIVSGLYLWAMGAILYQAML